MIQLMRFALILIIYLVPYGKTHDFDLDSQTYDEIKIALKKNGDVHGVLDKSPKYPRLHFEPNLESSFLVRYNKANQSTYAPHVNRLNSILAKYMYGGYDPMFIIYCDDYNEYRPVYTWEASCRFDALMNLGGDCVRQQTYGYEDGQPCILLSLERILNWLPEPYTNDTVPDKIRDEWIMYSVTVHCEAEDPVTKDNVGDILYYPKNGFRFAYFPYTGQTDWMNPLVFVRLDNPNPAMALRVSCSIYAKNVIQNESLGYGKVSFDVMVD